MDFTLSGEQRAFRASVDAWLRENPPEREDGMAGDPGAIERRRRWQRKLHDAGWVGIDWPAEYGGRGASPVEQVILAEAMIEAGAPELVNVIGLGMAGPTIISHGTPAQKERYLAPILSADEIWCQGFSEPNAGSDLAALATRAQDCGTHYVLNGQKVWTSYAHVAKWCIVLAREFTSPDPRAGLTYLLVDMESPGIEVRPLVQMTGDPEFNELFFSDVVVPKAQLLGAPGEGWRVAMTTLLHERATLGASLAAHAQVTARQLIDQVRDSGRGLDRLTRQRVAQLYLEARALQLNGYRALTAMRRSGAPGPEGSLMKLFWSDLNQRLWEAALDLQPLGAISRVGPVHYEFLRSRANSIEAGTSEILRNILAERVLGLPRSR